ncbi:MAG: hypothetical protein K6E30_01645 [Lachnospiraceae bacterium]|nr:hypothetical protein [Lachnospiraceae bacterium]
MGFFGSYFSADQIKLARKTTPLLFNTLQKDEAIKMVQKPGEADPSADQR